MTNSVDDVVNRIRKDKEHLSDIKNRCPQQWYESFTYKDYSIPKNLSLDDLEGYKMIFNDIFGVPKNLSSEFEKVIFNEPATIVFWKNGCKTVVKCQDNEPFDPEKGLAMAIAKYALGNEGNYYNTFTKYLPKEDENYEIVNLGNGLYEKKKIIRRK